MIRLPVIDFLNKLSNMLIAVDKGQTGSDILTPTGVARELPDCDCGGVGVLPVTLEVKISSLMSLPVLGSVIFRIVFFLELWYVCLTDGVVGVVVDG